jgi:glycosyltransferase involved in cell wall biosynthesis
MPAKISLAMTAYNHEAFVAQAIESVLAQTMGDFELIICDDASTDRTPDICREFATRDPRVTFHSVPTNLGNAAALKFAIDHTSPDVPYLAWVDSDDTLAPTALAETSAVLDASTEVGLVYTDYVVTDPQGRPRGLGKRCAIPYSRDRMLIDFMMFQFRLMRRELYDKVGGIEPNDPCAHDYDFCLRLSENTIVHHLKRPLYLYRMHPKMTSVQRRIEQITSSQDAIARALKRRGLADQLAIEVEIQGKFYLRKKSADEAAGTNSSVQETAGPTP